MKAQTITVPPEVPKRGIQQYVMAEAERIEKKFKYGIEESDQTHFDRYAEAWLNRQKPYFKATTLAGYRRNLEIVYPIIGGIPLAKIRPLTLEEMCEELRKRPGRNGNQIKECTVQKYLETVSSVLEDAKKNDIIPFNPAHRVRKKFAEKEKQHIPQKYEMQRLLKSLWTNRFCTKPITQWRLPPGCGAVSCAPCAGRTLPGLLSSQSATPAVVWPGREL